MEFISLKNIVNFLTVDFSPEIKITYRTEGHRRCRGKKFTYAQKYKFYRKHMKKPMKS